MNIYLIVVLNNKFFIFLSNHVNEIEFKSLNEKGGVFIANFHLKDKNNEKKTFLKDNENDWTPIQFEESIYDVKINFLIQNNLTRFKGIII